MLLKPKPVWQMWIKIGQAVPWGQEWSHWVKPNWAPKDWSICSNWSPKQGLVVGMWGLFFTQLASELRRYGIAVIGVAVVRWNTIGEITTTAGETGPYNKCGSQGSSVLTQNSGYFPPMLRRSTKGLHFLSTNVSNTSWESAVWTKLAIKRC